MSGPTAVLIVKRVSYSVALLLYTFASIQVNARTAASGSAVERPSVTHLLSQDIVVYTQANVHMGATSRLVERHSAERPH